MKMRCSIARWAKRGARKLCKQLVGEEKGEDDNKNKKEEEDNKGVASREAIFPCFLHCSLFLNVSLCVKVPAFLSQQITYWFCPIFFKAACELFHHEIVKRKQDMYHHANNRV